MPVARADGRSSGILDAAIVDPLPGHRQSLCVKPGSCDDDYKDLLVRVRNYAALTTRRDMERRIQRIMDSKTDVEFDAAPFEELRDAILDGLNMPFLFYGVYDRPLDVEVAWVDFHERFIEYELVFRDPWVGEFSAHLLLPYANGPFTAVIVNHGHGGSPDDSIYNYFGVFLAIEGFAVLLPSFRVNDSDDYEIDMSTRYLLQGFALGGIRIYETLLAFRFLHTLDAIDANRIFLMGHSGGSVLGNVTIRIENRFAGYISDLGAGYANTYWIDDVIPNLNPYYELINDFSTSTVPVLKQEYGYPDGPDAVFRFLYGHR